MLPGAASPALSQERGAVALGQAIQALGVNTRVLVIGAHPDDEDTFLIAWLSRGRHVETAYLSLTRGDGGQNLIGNELGEALGVIRTEELLAARRVDGAEQFFTRAFDFGFSKDTIDTYRHWPRDTILGDVVRVVRAFKPHVIIAVFSGTPRDGHGHHQVSGLLARTAYDLAGDTVRFPVGAYGAPWTPLKFYRNARYDPTGGVTLQFDVGEYSPLLGESYAEIAGQSRSQHKSQGFGAPQRKGSIMDALRREATRVNGQTPAPSETSVFDGIDTTWNRFRALTGGANDASRRAALDSLPAAIASAQRAFAPFTPSVVLPALARVQRLERVLSFVTHRDDDAYRDFVASFLTLSRRTDAALQLASSVEFEAFTDRELRPAGTPAHVVATTYNRGVDTVTLDGILPGIARSGTSPRDAGRVVAPGATLADTFDLAADTLAESIAQPYWLRTPRDGSMFTQPISLRSETNLPEMPALAMTGHLARLGIDIGVVQPVMYRLIDPVKGEIRQHAGVAPTLSVTVDQQTQYTPANIEFTRDFNVRVRSASDNARDVRVSLVLPAGLTGDSAARSVHLAGYDASQTVTFRLRGRLPAGMHRVDAVAESNGETYHTGYQLIDYDHIRRQRIYRRATSTFSAVDMRVPATLRVAYVTGVGDNVAPSLAQLGIPVTMIAADELSRADLQPYSTLVIGPRAYEAHPQLAAATVRILDFARAGGTVVVQYGQNEMTRPGVMPYPITLTRPADRVTEEDAAVTIDMPDDRLLRAPNRIDASDFAGWVQERALYMPHTFDEHYHALLSMHDTGEPPNRAAILVVPLGRGQYIYTTMSFFRQLPAGVPGGARLFLNLLSAGLPTSVTP